MRSRSRTGYEGDLMSCGKGFRNDTLTTSLAFLQFA